MARNIFIVNATQVVVSDSHPEGLFSVISGFPQMFDSRNYDRTEANPDGNPEKALNAAKVVYYNRLGANYAGSDTRVMSTVTLEQANGQLMMRDCVGAFPVIAPVEPEPEVVEEPEEEEPIEG